MKTTRLKGSLHVAWKEGAILTALVKEGICSPRVIRKKEHHG
jgi:hypothetical protein